MTSRIIFTVLLLVASNAFMTLAWYLHVKKQAWPLFTAIVISWLIALPEYILQVPANRIGHQDFGGPFGLPQLKVLQEAITLIVFSVMTIFVFKNEKLRTTDLIAFGLVFVAVAVSVYGRAANPSTLQAQPPAAAAP
jgi:uncharacterized protein (DUF486 family)